MQENTPDEKRPLPRILLVNGGIILFSALVLLAAVLFPSFADFFNGTVAAAFRAVLYFLTSRIPFSLSEILLYIFVPAGLVFAFVAAARCQTWRKAGRFLLCLLLSVGMFFPVFVFTLGTGYHTHTMDVRMELPEGEPTKEELIRTLEIVTARLSEAADGVEFGEDGFSVMPYDRREMDARLGEAFEAVSAEYPFLQKLPARTKPVLASPLMSYAHLTGVYTYFTGEANLNVDFPDYTLPFTAAHELAHQRGIAREDEANFTAFLVTSASDDAYLSYCAYLNLFEYTANALIRTDAEAYREILATLDSRVVGELRAYSAFFVKYKDSAVSAVSETMNDTFLKVNGNEAGTESYGNVVLLAIKYFRAS